MVEGEDLGVEAIGTKGNRGRGGKERKGGKGQRLSWVETELKVKRDLNRVHRGRAHRARRMEYSIGRPTLKHERGSTSHRLHRQEFLCHKATGHRGM
jgi:hypothetical protein